MVILYQNMLTCVYLSTTNDNKNQSAMRMPLEMANTSSCLGGSKFLNNCFEYEFCSFKRRIFFPYKWSERFFQSFWRINIIIVTRLAWMHVQKFSYFFLFNNTVPTAEVIKYQTINKRIIINNGLKG